MTMLSVRVRGQQIHRQVGGDSLFLGEPGEPIAEGGLEPLEAPIDTVSGLVYWSTVYARAVQRGNEKVLEALGEALYRWLDPGETLGAWLDDGERALEIRVDGSEPSELGAALLSLPWELLRRDGAYLAQDRVYLFTVVRRCSGLEASAPKYADLRLLFMAASPRGSVELDYEAEEAAILAATASRLGTDSPVQLQVEESGSREFLGALLQPSDPFEAVHLSAHGNIAVLKNDEPDGGDSRRRVEPFLALEDAAGEPDLVGASALIDTLEGAMPTLVFLSACRTAERGLGEGPTLSAEQLREGDSSASSEAEESELALADPFARQLCRRVPNVLGWDGSVHDTDATLFAESLYHQLGRGVSVPRAAAIARRQVHDLQYSESKQHARQGQHWHLARLYLGPGGGGALCNPTGGTVRPAPPDPEVPFLGKATQNIPVAPRAAFVGRRRSIQAVIGAFRNDQRSVLIHGMGNLGKSSVAARVVARLPSYRPVVVFGQCDAVSLFEAFGSVITDITAEMSDLTTAQVLDAEFTTLRQQVMDEQVTPGWALGRLLNGALKSYPVLLILDDLEQSLEEPRAGQAHVRPIPDCRETLTGILEVFARPTSARLLMTSRYDFVAPDAAGHDGAADVVRVPLTPMSERAQQKQWQARVRFEKSSVSEAIEALVKQALVASTGNPGLQSVLTQPLLAGEIEAAQAAIEAIIEYRKSGTEPEAQGDLGDFFTRMSFKRYRAALDEHEQRALSLATLFRESLVVPRAALEAVLIAGGVAEAGGVIDRLLALGLLDDAGERRVSAKSPAYPHAALNPLARPLAAPLEPQSRAKLARASLAPLAEAWCDANERFPEDIRAETVVRLCLLSEADDESTLLLLEAASNQAVRYLHKGRQDPIQAHELARAAFAVLDGSSVMPSASLLFRLIHLAEAVGDARWHDALLAQVPERADIEGRDRALLLGQLADRLHQRGKLEEALRIRTEEELPVYTALGDKRSIAVTQGQIADIHMARGEFDEALRIRTEEELPVYTALGDKRLIAVTQGQIGDIHMARGEVDEALRLRTEEELPVYTALGDKREIAVTQGKIGDIHMARGELEEALRLRTEEVLPVYTALGDKRSIAVTQGQIGDIHMARGEVDEALRLRTEEELPVYTALGDKREIAVTQGKIGDIHMARGELDKALRCYQDESLPLLKAIGDERSIAYVQSRIDKANAARAEST